MAGYFDFLIPKNEYPFTGTYYRRRPKTTEDIGVEFNYDIVNNKTATKPNVLDALEVLDARLTVKTVEVVSFIVKGYIVAQDGDLWQIDSITTKISDKEKEAYRLWRKPTRKETILGLIKVQNPWNLE